MSVAMRKINKKIIVLLLLGLVVHQHPVISLVSMLSGGMQALGTFNEIHDTYLKFTTPSTQDVLDKTIELAVSLEKMEEQLDNIQSAINDLLTSIPRLTSIASDVQLLNKYFTRIDMLYDELLYYLENPEYFVEDSHDELFKAFTSYGSNDVAGSITQINGLIVPRKLGSHKESLFLLLAKGMQTKDVKGCGIDGALPQQLQGLFNSIIDAEMKASILMGFGYTMQSFLTGRNTTGLLRRATQQLEKRNGQYLNIVKKALAYVPSIYRRCDPTEGHERGVTFYEFERFLTAFIVQETAMDEDGQCDKTCWQISHPTNLYKGCKGFECDGGDTTCHGKVANCAPLLGGTTVCEYRPLQSRRYSWWQNSGQIYGPRKSDCSEGVIHHPGHYWYYHYECDLCRCICVEDSQWSWSSRSLSLREQVSNIEDNMVITGLQFVIKDKVAHVRIMQGQIGPGAVILNGTASWIEPENIKFDHSNDGFILTSEDGSEQRMSHDEGAAALSWWVRRINLDDLSLPEQHVLTGIRLSRNKNQADWPIQLEIRGTLVDLETFELVPDSSTWIAPDDDQKREVYAVEEGDNPIRSTRTTIDSKPYMYLDMHWTSFELDGAQATIPFLDAQPVYGRPLIPITRVGLYHKKQPGYGGFLTFVLEGFNRAPYLSMEDVAKPVPEEG